MARNLSEAAKQHKTAYDAKYMRENVKQLRIYFNTGNKDDLELMDWIKQQGNQTQYLKEIIREDKLRKTGK